MPYFDPPHHSRCSALRGKYCDGQVVSVTGPGSAVMYFHLQSYLNDLAVDEAGLAAANISQEVGAVREDTHEDAISLSDHLGEATTEVSTPATA